MLQNYNKWKVLRVFFDSPLAEGGLRLREISRKASLALPSVKNYLLDLQRDALIVQKKSRVHGYPAYYANRDDEKYHFYKKVDCLTRIKESGLLLELQEKSMPSVIILFGSAAKGEDTEYSDIDLFIGASEQKINVSKYEKVLNRKISLFFEPEFNRLSKELKNNIINGIIISGYLKVF